MTRMSADLIEQDNDKSHFSPLHRAAEKGFQQCCKVGDLPSGNFYQILIKHCIVQPNITSFVFRFIIKEVYSFVV